MPNNPLYPGYSEKKKGSDQSNPLYPGYYTGQPIPRRPQSKNFLKPIEYDFGELTEQIDNAAEKVKHSPINFPRWVWERIVDDAKESLAASIKPSGVSVTEMEDYAVEDLPGAVGMSLSLNPEDWKDPKKQAFKTLSSWTKTAIGVNPKDLTKPDFSDIENEARKKLWHAVLGFEEKDTSKEGSLSKLEVNASEAIGERTKTFANVVTNKSDPFNINGVNVDLHIPIPGKKIRYKVDPQKNIYKESADNITNYVNIQQANKLRDPALDKVTISTAKAINTEIKAKKSKIERDLKEGPKTQMERDRLRFLKDTLDKKEGAREWFEFKTDTALEMKKINDLLNDDGIVDNIEKAIVNVNKEKQDALFNPKDPKIWEEFTGKKGIFKTIRNKQTGELVRLEHAKDLLNNGKITQKSFNEFEKIMRDQDSYIRNLESAINDIQKGNMSRSAIVRRLGAVRGQGGVRLTGGDIFQNSAQRKLLKTLNSDLNSNAEDAVGSILTDEGLRSADLDFDGRKLIPVVERLRQERLTLATEELFDAAWDGKLAERYLWNSRIKPQLNVFTPDTFISNTLKKSNTLGLLIGKDFDVKKRFPNNPLKQARWVKRHEYKFGLELDKDFVEKWDIKGLKKNVLLLAGGDHFKLIKSFNKFNFESVQDRILMKDLLSGHIDPLSAYALREFKNRKIDDDIYKFAQQLKEQLKTYKDKMAELAKELGITNLDDPEMQLELLKRLMEKDKKLPSGYGILRKYAGHLDKLYVKIDNLSKWFRGTKVGKFIGGYNNLKSLISEKLATWITNLLGAAAATTGIMKVLWPIIRGLIKKVIEKAIDTAQKTIKAFIKMDFDEVSEVLNENAKKAVRGCVIIILPPLLLIWFVVFFIFNLFAGSISPVDPTIKTTILEGTLLENPVIKLEKHAYVTLSDGTILVDPKRIENEEIQKGISVEYKVEVTPKVTITDGSVKLSDKVIRINENDSGFEIKSFGSQTLNTFIAGKGFDVDYGPIEMQGSGFEDSYIINRATADTPAVPSRGISAGGASASRAFMIGEYVPTCPILAGSPYILTISYNSQVGKSHGSSGYCQQNPGVCRGSQPYSWGTPCVGTGCKYYGYSLDIGDEDHKTDVGEGKEVMVTFPPLSGKDVTWTVIRKIYNDAGRDGLEAVSSDGKWRITYTHIECESQVFQEGSNVFKPGEEVCKLTNITSGAGTNKHTHIELFDLTKYDPDYPKSDVLGVPVKPECYMCGTKFELYSCD